MRRERAHVWSRASRKGSSYAIRLLECTKQREIRVLLPYAAMALKVAVSIAGSGASVEQAFT